jgi:steroid delta-isomerase-like uncharacterized protein
MRHMTRQQNGNPEAYCREKETKMVRYVRPLALLVFGLIFALLPVGARADGDEDRGDGSCSHERALRIAHNYADAWNSHDPNVVVTFFTKTVFYQDVPGEAQAPGQFTFMGTERLRAFASQIFAGFPDLNIKIVETEVTPLLCGNRGAFQWIFSGTDPQSHKMYSVHGISPVKVEGDLIAWILDYWDKATLYRQVGLLPSGL